MMPDDAGRMTNLVGEYELPGEAVGLRRVLSQDFLADVREFSEKWDREWIRYFYLHDDNSYFHSYGSSAYRLPLPPEEIATFTAHESLTRRIDPEWMHTKLQIFLPGDALVDKDVFEIGCGVGMLGRLLGSVARSYTGYDYSPLALQIARLTSPARCRYIHAGETQRVAQLYNSADTCFGRHFFIHNNFENAMWVLRMLRDVVRDDGRIQADFFNADGPSDRIFPSKSSLVPGIASCGFFYTDDEIYELAEVCDLEVEAIHRVESPPRVFTDFRRRTRR